MPERLRWLLAAEADRAREYLRRGQRSDAADRRRQPACAVGSGEYLRRLLEKIAERKYDVFSKKVSLTAEKKSSFWERVC